MNELEFELGSRLGFNEFGWDLSFALGFSAKAIPKSLGLVSASKGQWVGLVKIPSFGGNKLSEFKS